MLGEPRAITLWTQPAEGADSLWLLPQSSLCCFKPYVATFTVTCPVRALLHSSYITSLSYFVGLTTVNVYLAPSQLVSLDLSRWVYGYLSLGIGTAFLLVVLQNGGQEFKSNKDDIRICTFSMWLHWSSPDTPKHAHRSVIVHLSNLLKANCAFHKELLNIRARLGLWSKETGSSWSQLEPVDSVTIKVIVEMYIITAYNWIFFY